MRRFILFVLMLLASTGACRGADDSAAVKRELWRRVFGDLVVFSPERVREVRALPAGRKLAVEGNGDGYREVWFIDGDARHDAKVRPLLVRVIDEDGDMPGDQGADQGEPDTDSDLYIVDYHADGDVDVVLDYHDADGDDDVDEMAMFFFSPRDRFLGGPALRVWWARDDGDDNRLWHTINYTYSQRDCQWLCDFSGEETFVAFGLTMGATEWTPIWENPFLFFDPDGEGASEIVVRYQGVGDEVEALRYSFDVDDNAVAGHRHDYDFSISAVTQSRRWYPELKTPPAPLRLPPGVLETTVIRGIPTGGFIRRDEAQRWAITAPWHRTLLTWDEIGVNVNRDWRAEPQERWEGVIAHPSAEFPQIGGPTCGPLNKRNEVATDPPAKIELYWAREDGRLHLVGASEGWITFDFDDDGEADGRCDYIDADRDGFFDERRLDLNGDGQAEFIWPMRAGRGDVRQLDWAELKAFYVPKLNEAVAEARAFLNATGPLLPEGERVDEVERAFGNLEALWPGAPGIARQISGSAAGQRFYLELMCHRRLARLKALFGGDPRWGEAEARYGAGDWRGAAGMLTMRAR